MNKKLCINIMETSLTDFNTISNSETNINKIFDIKEPISNRVGYFTYTS